MKINLTLSIPEAKTFSELREFTLNLLKIGSQYSLVDYEIVNFKMVEGISRSGGEQ